MNDIANTISILGFEAFAEVTIAGFVGWLVRWLLKSLSSDIERARSEAREQHKEMFDITIKLVDRIRGLEEGRLRSLEDSMLRTELLARLFHDLPQDWGRLGKSKDGE